MSRVLVVDDNHDILEVMMLLLRTRNYHVDMTPKGEEIFSKIEAFNPDLIIMDVYLGGWDGRDICKQIKAKKETKDIPVIMFSAYQQAEESTFKFGADDFIGKPFEIEELINKIEKLLQASGKKASVNSKDSTDKQHNNKVSC